MNACIICVKRVRFETHSKYPRAPRAVTAQSSCYGTIGWNLSLKENSYFHALEFWRDVMNKTEKPFKTQITYEADHRNSLKITLLNWRYFHSFIPATSLWPLWKLVLSMTFFSTSRLQSQEHMDLGKYFRSNLRKWNYSTYSHTQIPSLYD